MRRLLRTALRLRRGFEVVGEAGDGAEAVRLAGTLLPDVVVLDLGLPDLAGREVLSGVRAGSPTTKVVVFSGRDSDEEHWVAENVEGYVLKDAAIDHLVDLLESVGRRDVEAMIELPRDASSVREARRFITATLTEWRLESLLDDVLLVASELATNAITHADSGYRLRLSLNDSGLRVDVIDSGDGTPEPQPPSWTAEHGRGLLLVDALTTAWGLEVVPDGGKLVWAELAGPG